MWAANRRLPVRGPCLARLLCIIIITIMLLINRHKTFERLARELDDGGAVVLQAMFDQ
jgi:hypothetical protein